MLLVERGCADKGTDTLNSCRVKSRLRKIHTDMLIIAKRLVNPPFSRIRIRSPSHTTSPAPFRPTDFAAPEHLTPKNGSSGAPQAHECPALSQSSRIPTTWPGLSGEAHAFSSPRFTPDAPTAPQALRSGRSSGPVRRRGLPNPPPAFVAPRSCASDRSARGGEQRHSRQRRRCQTLRRRSDSEPVGG